MTASHELASLVAESLREAVVEAISAEVRRALEAQHTKAPERLLSVGEAAELANCHAETIRRAVKSGRLPAVLSLGRRPKIRHEDLEVFLASTGGAK